MTGVAGPIYELGKLRHRGVKCSLSVMVLQNEDKKPGILNHGPCSAVDKREKIMKIHWACYKVWQTLETYKIF